LENGHNESEKGKMARFHGEEGNTAKEAGSRHRCSSKLLAFFGFTMLGYIFQENI